MNKLIITVLGKDRPGIIAFVTNLLYELDCNLENVNQMIMQNEFAGFFIIEKTSELELQYLKDQLNEKSRSENLTIHVNKLDSNRADIEEDKGETFLITTIGPDQKGLVARFSGIMASFNANITNLKAVFKGGKDPMANIMSYQVSITDKVDQKQLFKELKQKAAELDLDIRIQHKNIFDAINKI